MKFTSEDKKPFFVMQDLNQGLYFKTGAKIRRDIVLKKIQNYVLNNIDSLKNEYRPCLHSEVNLNKGENKNFFEKCKLKYLGKEYDVNIHINDAIKTNEIEFDDEFNIYIRKEELMKHRNFYQREDIIIDLIVEWYRDKTKKMIKKKVEDFKDFMGLDPQGIIVKFNMHKNLATCSEKGNLTFVWSMAKFGEALIDFIIVYVMAQLKEEEHTEDFWDLMDEYINSSSEMNVRFENAKLNPLVIPSCFPERGEGE